MIAKWYEVETFSGVKKVQGLGEKFVAESLNRFGIKWDRPKAIKTPFGNYTPDFWCESAGVFIEVKGWRTALMMIGLKGFLNNGKANWAKKVDETSFNKMKWVHENIAPIDIYLNDSANDAKYLEYRNTLEDKIKDFRFVYTRDAFLATLRMDWYLHKRVKKVQKQEKIMSIKCGLELKIEDIKVENRNELLKDLLQFRPEDSVRVVDNIIVEFPCTFNDDVSECIINFMEKYKITTEVKITLDDEEFDMIFVNGKLEEEEE